MLLALSEAPLSPFDLRRVVWFTYPQCAFQTIHALQKEVNGVKWCCTKRRETHPLPLGPNTKSWLELGLFVIVLGRGRAGMGFGEGEARDHPHTLVPLVSVVTQRPWGSGEAVLFAGREPRSPHFRPPQPPNGFQRCSQGKQLTRTVSNGLQLTSVIGQLTSVTSTEEAPTQRAPFPSPPPPPPRFALLLGPI